MVRKSEGATIRCWPDGLPARDAEAEEDELGVPL